MSNSNPGKHQRAAITARIGSVPFRLRTAVAAAEVERVMPIIEHYLVPDQSRHALRLVWDHATGVVVDPSDVQSTIQQLDSHLNELYDEDETGFVMQALFAVYHALRSVTDASPKPAELSMFAAMEAASLDDPTRGEANIEEEGEWLLRALAVAERWPHPQAARDMFAGVGAAPSWVPAGRWP